MKKFVFIILASLFLWAMAGCSTPVSQPAAETPIEPEETGIISVKGDIGVSLSQDNAFNDDFMAAFKKLSEENGYNVVVESADKDHKKQTDDILEMVNSGVKIIVIDPVNIDELEQAIGECDAAGIPVINLLEPINDVTAMLISPDYKKMGEKAAEKVKALIKNGDKVAGNVLMLQGSFDSFLMQMYHDGFLAELPASETVSIEMPFCDFDETKAYDAVKTALASDKKPNAIFSQSESMAKGALKAVEEAGESVKIVTIGADADIIAAIQSGKIQSAVYLSPRELAGKTSLYVQKYLADSETELPTYTSLTIASADEENAASLLAPGNRYAGLPDESSGTEPENSESRQPESTGSQEPPASS